jgi:hypothetical protein
MKIPVVLCVVNVVEMSTAKHILPPTPFNFMHPFAHSALDVLSV